MDYASNSHESKKAKKKAAEKPPAEVVVTGEVIKPKKSVREKFRGVFFGGDFKSAASYVAADVLLPAMRNTLADAAKGAVDRVIFGETRRSNVGGRPMYSGRTQYNNPINRAARPDPRMVPQHSYSAQRRSDDVEYIIQDRDEAYRVLELMAEIVDQFESACVADLNDRLGVPINHVDQKWGWYDLRGAQVTQVREGYLLQFPPPVELD